MKKINLFIVLAFLFIGLNLNAQKIFVGGGLSLNSTSSTATSGSTTVNGPSNLNWSFSPEVGYYLSDNLAIGLSLQIVNSSTTTPVTTTANDVTNDGTWALKPFARLSFAKTGNLSLFGEGYLSIGGGSSTKTSGTTTTNGPTKSTFGIGVQPGVSYDLSNKVSLIAKMGGISFSSVGTSETQGTGSTAVTVTTSKPNFSIDLGLNGISIGAIVKF